ncbi:lipid-A-disaccharide synthase [Sporomusa acidovorans]|uniref:Lipid-A-disaccharide synthase n=1 Tax=Sporomusa acidovorans (strain ATCC 49682 / DSM 3132 / Mol) TaxID=1123286 RepID=A0ABZ3J724_SPOA4|nr:lipid-A-disaccharide synthase [Sporomusa acidovorans]OZC19298.1 lipid-A-disaccharide synthase [Sporomusa acidovorans DSM 3132]SDD81490.1 lipid-A-disaccharide synthase [Sporomusa acidovorans]
MKIMLSAGEASGDMHGASVAGALKLLQPDIELFGMGSKAMLAAGVRVDYDIAGQGIMGLVEVIKNLGHLFALRDKLADLMDKECPDALVIIDYPDFNMRLAKIAKKKGIPVISYISPSAWAWRRGRAKEVAKIVDKIAAIFPFEAEVYQAAGADVTFVGHPLVDIVKPALSAAEACRHFNADPDRPLVMIMPGSRQQEIDKLLPVMLAAARIILDRLPACQFFLPVASTISREILQNIIDGYHVPVTLTSDYTYDLMGIADVAIAASGTATLETSLMGAPTVIIYKMAPLTYFLGKFLVKIPNIGLPNIVAGRRIVPELLQDAANPENIAAETLKLLTDSQVYNQVQADLAAVKAKLGQVGAVKRVAEVILAVAQKKEVVR